MPLEKKKHPYQHKEPVELYSKTHETPDIVKEKIADFILELAQGLITGSEKISILDAGLGEGSVITIPLISKAIEKQIPLDIVGFDNSLEMLDRFHSNLQNAFSVTITRDRGDIPLFLNAEFDEKVSLTVYKADIEKKESFNSFKDILHVKKFDICLSFFLLHHLINWRDGLSELINMTTDMGYFIYAERLHDIAVMDGDQKRLYELKKEAEKAKKNEKIKFYVLLEHLCKERNEILLWNPEISATNYEEVKNTLRCLSLENKNLNHSQVLLFNYDITYHDFISWVKNGVYTHFWWGLASEDRNILLNKIAEKIPDHDDKINIKDGLNIIAHQIYRRQEIDIKKYLFTDGLHNNKIAAKLHSPVDLKIPTDPAIRYKTLKDLLALISTHDLIAPTTLWAFLTYWSIAKDTFDEKMPFSVVKIDPNNVNELVDNISFMVLYFILIEQINFSITQFIFRDLSKRPTLIIKKGEAIQYEFTKDWNGDLSFVDITIPETGINSPEEIGAFLRKAKRKIKQSLTTNELVHETRGTIVFIEWGKIFESFKKSETTLKWGSLINNAQLAEFSAEFKNKTKAFQRDTDVDLFSRILQEPSEWEGFVKVLSIVGLLFSCTDLTHIAYIGSETVVEKDQIDDTESNYGFGGAIIGERISSDSDLEATYLKSRCKLLRTILNRRYAQFGIGEYAESRKNEIEKKINLLEQTYHDITRRYLNIFENETATSEVAGLLRSKIDYLMRLARGEVGSIEEREMEVKDELSNLFNLLDYELKDKFEIDSKDLDSLQNIKIKTYPGAFRTLFENLIGNTCSHAWDGSKNVSIFIRCNENNNGIIYKDNGQGFPTKIEGTDILNKIGNWFRGIFTELDMEQRMDKGTIRGMGLYIVKQASDFLNWNITPKKAKYFQNGKVQIEYHISWRWRNDGSHYIH